MTPKPLASTWLQFMIILGILEYGKFYQKPTPQRTYKIKSNIPTRYATSPSSKKVVPLANPVYAHD